MLLYSRSWGRGCTFVRVAGKCTPGRRIYGNIWRWAAEWLRLRLTSPASIALTDQGSRPRFSSTCSRCTTSSRQLFRWTSFIVYDSFRSAISVRSQSLWILRWNSFSTRETMLFGTMFLSYGFIGVCKSVTTHTYWFVPVESIFQQSNLWTTIFL